MQHNLLYTKYTASTAYGHNLNRDFSFWNISDDLNAVL